MTDLTQVAEVLAAHVERHLATVGGELWCATCDQPIGSAEGDDEATDLVIAAHQAEALAAAGLVATETEWGVQRYPSLPVVATSEAVAHDDADRHRRQLMTRNVTPWRPADEANASQPASDHHSSGEVMVSEHSEAQR